jgi:hypothetical protein
MTQVLTYQTYQTPTQFSFNSLKRSIDEMEKDLDLTACFDRLILAPKKKKIKTFQCTSCTEEKPSNEIESCYCGLNVCKECLEDSCKSCKRCESCCQSKSCSGCGDEVCCMIEEYDCEDCGEMYCETCYIEWFDRTVCYTCAEKST